MKSGYEYELSESQKEAVIDLSKSFDKDPLVFSFNGVMFLGDKTEVVKRYVALNPSDRFFIWLQNNIPMLYENS